MKLEFPYQLVAFINKEPNINEPVYYGENDWYPQIALKRRFKLNSINEEDLISRLEKYCSNKNSFIIKTGDLIKPDHMPVKVLGVEQSPELMSFHEDFITLMAPYITSRYPDREGANYFPHITAEYNGKMVIDKTSYCNKDILIKKIFLLKDQKDENSIAYRVFKLS